MAYNYGCADTLKNDRAVYALPPYARFKYQLNCTNKNLVNFTDTSIIDASHLWDFGDGNTSTAPNPAHNYLNPGTYTVNLYTTNKACHDTATKTIHVINEEGQISIQNNIFCRGDLVDADLAGINTGNVISTTWNFGDGIIRTINGKTQVNHTYGSAGKFLITATMDGS